MLDIDTQINIHLVLKFDTLDNYIITLSKLKSKYTDKEFSTIDLDGTILEINWVDYYTGDFRIDLDVTTNLNVLYKLDLLKEKFNYDKLYYYYTNSIKKLYKTNDEFNEVIKIKYILRTGELFDDYIPLKSKDDSIMKTIKGELFKLEFEQKGDII